MNLHVTVQRRADRGKRLAVANKYHRILMFGLELY